MALRGGGGGAPSPGPAPSPPPEPPSPSPSPSPCLLVGDSQPAAPGAAPGLALPAPPPPPPCAGSERRPAAGKPGGGGEPSAGGPGPSEGGEEEEEEEGSPAPTSARPGEAAPAGGLSPVLEPLPESRGAAAAADPPDQRGPLPLGAEDSGTSQLGLGALELSQSQELESSVAANSEDKERVQPRDTTLEEEEGSEGDHNTAAPGEITGFGSDCIESSQVMSSSTPRILQLCKETISCPISTCGQHERRPQAKEPLRWGSPGAEILSTQEDIFDQTRMTASTGSSRVPKVEDAGSPTRTPADSLHVLHLSGQQGPLFTGASGGTIPSPESSQSIPLIVPRSPTEQSPEAGREPKESLDEKASSGLPQASTPVSNSVPSVVTGFLPIPSQPEFSHDTFLPTPSLEEGPETQAEKGKSSETLEKVTASPSTEDRLDAGTLALSASEHSQ